MSKLKNPNELNIRANLKALIYGQPGIGKTTLSLSAPNPVLLDYDNGVHRLRPEHQVPTLEVSSWKDTLEVIPELKPFRTIVIDTAGNMLDYIGAYLIEQNPKLSKGNGSLTLQGYGERKAEFKRFLKQISIMGKHIIFVAHEREEKSGDDKYIRPEVGGSSGTDLYKELDIIGYMEAIGKKRTISFAATEKYYAKNSCGFTDVINLTELSRSISNNFFETKIVRVYEQSLKERALKVSEYTELMDVSNAKIECVVDAETANEVLDWIEKVQHIWTSKLISKTNLFAKITSLGLHVNTKTKKIENGKS
jgi:hypothetical protein